MSSNDINAQRAIDAIKRCILASCMKVPHAPNPTFEELKGRVRTILNHMQEQGTLSATHVRVIDDTAAEKLVREIMEEEEDRIRMEVQLAVPITYLTLNFKIGSDS